MPNRTPPIIQRAVAFLRKVDRTGESMDAARVGSEQFRAKDGAEAK